MTVNIFKYNQSGTNKNFFDRNSNLVFVDKFVYERQLLNAFPIFREEWSQEDNVNVLKSGYFDIKMPLSSSERSIVNGQSILDFFESLGNDIKNYKFIAVCETDNPDRNYSGIIDLYSIKLDLNVNEGQYYINLSVTGIESELVELLKQTYITRLVYDEIFESQYISRLLYWANPTYLQIRNRLDLIGKLGFDLKIDRALQNSVWDSNLDPSGTYCTISNWEAFKSFLVGFGFRFKLSLGANSLYAPGFFITLYYRSDGINSLSVDKYLREERGLVLAGTEYLAIFYTHVASSNPSIDYYTGFILGKNGVTISDSSRRFEYNKDTRVYSYNYDTWREDEINILDLQLYNGNLAAGDIALCRLIEGYTINNLLTHITNNELGYLIEGVKQKRLLKCKVPGESSLTLGSLVNLETEYVCERINSYDNFNETMEIELVEA